MGGKGSGGRRAGAGRKPKSAAERAVTGNPGHRKPASVLAHPSAPPVVPVLELDEADCPNELESPQERKVWLQLAPLAMANGTLTPATAVAFVEVCKTVLVVQGLEAAPLQRGTNLHRSWKQLLDGQLSAFRLRPDGKPVDQVPSAAKPVSPLDKYLKRHA